jgi:hypothetical protein
LFSLWKKFAYFDSRFGSGSAYNECGSETLTDDSTSAYYKLNEIENTPFDRLVPKKMCCWQ